MQFTDKLIKALKPKETRYDLREANGDGFAIRISPSQIKSWVFFYHFEGKKRRMTLGNYPDLSLADARAQHRQALTLLSRGIDPGQAQRQNELEARMAPTVNVLANEYIEIWAKPRKRSWKEDLRILNKDVLPVWGKYKAKDITRRDIVLLLDKILERGAPISANRTLAVIRRMFNFAIERDILSISPCHSIKAVAKENRRERVLSEDEILKFWLGLDNASMTEPTKIALKLQLITAQRKGEIISAEWEEFDLTNGWWNIPASKSKNGNSHRVPLSNLALALLNDLKSQSNICSQWLFPSPTGKAHISPTSVDHALRKNLYNLPENERFTPHDLRRTAASHITAMGISRLILSKLLNHVDSHVTAIYDRHTYDREKRQSLDLWDTKIQRILSMQNNNTNVIDIMNGRIV